VEIDLHPDLRQRLHIAHAEGRSCFRKKLQLQAVESIPDARLILPLFPGTPFCGLALRWLALRWIGLAYRWRL
jgi:hypothetical protein